MRTVKIQRQPNFLYKYHFYFENFYSQENLNFLNFTTAVDIKGLCPFQEYCN